MIGTMPDTVVATRGLSFSYGDQEIIHDVDLTIDAGEVVAVSGPSGCGKSTLLYCMAGLLTADSGSVVLAGTDLTGLDDNARTTLRREKCGFVFQFGELVPELSLLDNVALILEVNGVARRQAIGKARELLAELKVDSVADHLPAHVSGGQAQRAAVARAIAHEPKIVFADEPTGSVDPDNAAIVLDQLLTLTRSRSCAVALVSHDRDVVARADRVLTVRSGRISE